MADNPNHQIEETASITGDKHTERLPQANAYNSGVRRNLVVCTCGKDAPEVFAVLHSSRKYDIAIINFTPDVRSYRNCEAELHFESPGYKWINIKRFLENTNVAYCYDYVWFPDHDILAAPSDVNVLFDIAMREDLQLCQPSLTLNSYFSWAITRHQAGRDVRFTNFVEIMCPLFRTDALRTCLPTFDLNYSGWGLCFLWPKLLSYQKIGIVHAIQVQHTHPVNSPNWRFDDGSSPQDEMRELMRIHGISDNNPREVPATM